MIMIGFALAFVIGLTLGLFGGGGSILTVPVFVYVLGYDPKLAIAMSLPVVGATSLIGAVGHWRAGNVRLGSAFSLGAAAMFGAYIGARTSAHVSGQLQLLVLGVTMLTAAALMLRDSFRRPAATATIHPGTATNALPDRPAPLPLFLAAGVAVGLLTGLIGIGGGFLIVPALVLLARVPMREAVGTSLLVIAMNSAAGLAGQPRIQEIPLGFVITFSGIAIVGILAGTALVRYVDQRLLKRGFAVLLLLIAVLIVWQRR